MRAITALMLLTLALAGCKAKPVKTDDGAGAPQVATSIDDYALPTDKSDQITSIDAATGDASGMPGDGGAVVQAHKHVAAIVQAPADSEPANTQAVITPPAKPEFTIQDIPGTN